MLGSGSANNLSWKACFGVIHWARSYVRISPYKPLPLKGHCSIRTVIAGIVDPNELRLFFIGAK